MAFNFISIMRVTPSNGVGKYMQFETEAEADAHIAKFLDSFPDAYVAPHPGPSGLSFWVCDPVAKTVTVDTTAQTAGDDLRNWKMEMQDTDKYMTNEGEELIDSMTDAQKARLPQARRDIYTQRKEIRGRKP